MAIIRILFIVLISLVVSCSSSTDFNKIKSISELYLNQNIEKPYKIFKSEELEKFNYPIIEVRTNHILKQALMLPVSSRFNYHNYISGMGQSITFYGSAIIKTLGMDIGLVSLEFDEKRHLVEDIDPHDWPKFNKMTFKIIGPSFNLKEYKVSCNIMILENTSLEILDKSFNVFKIEEKCSNLEVEFKNLYFVNQNGEILKSKQFIPPKNIYIEVTRIKNT